VLPRSGKSRAVKLRRSVSYQLPEQRPQQVEEIKPGIVYMDLERLTDKEFEQALPKLEKAKGIIFDLRGYPQLSTAPLAHLTDEPVQSPQWHVPVSYFPDRKNVTFQRSGWPVMPQRPRLKAKAAFLAEIVGSPTAGTNGNVNPFALPGCYRLSWTGMKVLKQDGSQHHGVGILPTIPVARTIKGVTEGRDEVLEKGIASVSQ
jgi:C-terminal processing protease CtpA/Prc